MVGHSLEVLSSFRLGYKDYVWFALPLFIACNVAVWEIVQLFTLMLLSQINYFCSAVSRSAL